mgnify:CR=1 FL=1
MIFLGYFLRKRLLITQTFEHELGNLLLNVILPICVLGSANVEFSSDFSHNLIMAGIISVAYYLLAILALFFFSKVMKSKEVTKKIFILLCVFANTAFLGIPILSEFYGSEGVLYAVIYNLVYQIFFFSFGVTIVSGKTENLIRNVLTDPGTIASILAVIIFLSPFRFPVPITDTIDSIGGMMVPLSTIIIGCKLAEIRPKEILTDKLSYLVSSFRLLVFPVILYLVLKPFNLSNVLTASMVILTGLPSGALNVIVADKFHCDESFAARAVSQSTFLMVFSLPLLFVILSR